MAYFLLDELVYYHFRYFCEISLTISGRQQTKYFYSGASRPLISQRNGHSACLTSVRLDGENRSPARSLSAETDCRLIIICRKTLGRRGRTRPCWKSCRRAGSRSGRWWRASSSRSSASRAAPASSAARGNRAPTQVVQPAQPRAGHGDAHQGGGGAAVRRAEPAGQQVGQDLRQLPQPQRQLHQEPLLLHLPQGLPQGQPRAAGAQGPRDQAHQERGRQPRAALRRGEVRGGLGYGPARDRAGHRHQEPPAALRRRQEGGQGPGAGPAHARGADRRLQEQRGLRGQEAGRQEAQERLHGRERAGRGGGRAASNPEAGEREIVRVRERLLFRGQN